MRMQNLETIILSGMNMKMILEKTQHLNGDDL